MDYTQQRKEEIIKLLSKPLTSTASGKGLLNNMINVLPFELHLSRYKYLGPGTHLAKKLKQDVQPINKLNPLAREHDIDYSKSNDFNDCYKADYTLQEGSWNRVLSKDAGLGEKATAWVTNNAMKAKCAIGAGLLTKHPINLDAENIAKLMAAVQEGKVVTVTVSALGTKDSIMNEIYLPMTAS